MIGIFEVHRTTAAFTDNSGLHQVHFVDMLLLKVRQMLHIIWQTRNIAESACKVGNLLMAARVAAQPVFFLV
jgi:hypothetical protein